MEVLKMKVLITGGSGRLGREILKQFSYAKYTPLSPSIDEMNVIDQIAVDNYIKKTKPDIVIHLAAAVSPPKCEEDKKWAWDTTILGTIHMIDTCKKYVPNCLFALMSTPCIFSGEDETPKHENYIPYPDNFYGLIKMIQEILVSRSNLKYLIIRGNFVSYEKWPYPKAFTDRKSNYLFSFQLAKGIREVIEAGMVGVVHVLGYKILSMYDLAKLCPESENVQPTNMEEYYKENPNTCKLTKSMVMESTRWKLYDIMNGI
jgi:dTDP-4-dehydrorhamnose reductase